MQDMELLNRKISHETNVSRYNVLFYSVMFTAWFLIVKVGEWWEYNWEVNIYSSSN